MQLRAETSLFDDALLYGDINDAKEKADDSYQIAYNVNQYFWFNQTGSDTGAHIAYVGKDTFEDTHIGYNLLLSSDAIALRYGLYALAVLDMDSLDFYAFDESTLTNPKVASFGSTAIIGINDSGYSRTEISSTGIDFIRSDNGDIVLAHLGYASGTDSSGGTSIAPYYTFGIRASATYGNYSVAEGYNTTASGWCSHAEGSGTTASHNDAHAEGYSTTASYQGSHAEGCDTKASEYGSHAEGNRTEASGDCSHAEGFATKATDYYSHAEGGITTSSGYASHAEGYGCTASEDYSHAEGFYTTSSGYASHAEGMFTEASGKYSHASGSSTTAAYDYQFVIGKYNVNSSNNIFEIGYDKNIFCVTYTGSVWCYTGSYSSDIRLKTHLNYLGDDAIEFVRNLKPAHFIMNELQEHHTGFYAQDIQSSDPWGDLVITDSNGYLALHYNDIIAPLVAYCQHLEERIEKLEQKEKE